MMLHLMILVGMLSFVVSMALTAVMRWGSRRIGLIDQPGEYKVHESATPSGGGVAIFFAIWTPVIIGVAVCAYIARHGAPSLLDPKLVELAPGVLQWVPKLGIIFLGAFVIWLLGLADDLWNLSPWLRLAVHILVALMLVACGLSVSLFFESAWIRAVLTVLWVVGLINAFNMLDNMDGLSAGVATIIAAAFLVVSLQTEQFFIAAFLCCFIGATTGFLVFNFPPATIFMGDSGGTLIGYLLATMTVVFTFLKNGGPERPYFPLAVPLLMFGLPLFDMVTVLWIRIRSGCSPWKGDTNHFSHRLVALGMSSRQAVLTIYLVTATVSLGATALFYASTGAMIIILIQTVAVFTIIGILERAHPKKTSPPE